MVLNLIYRQEIIPLLYSTTKPQVLFIWVVRPAIKITKTAIKITNTTIKITKTMVKIIKQKIITFLINRINRISSNLMKMLMLLFQSTTSSTWMIKIPLL